MQINKYLKLFFELSYKSYYFLKEEGLIFVLYKIKEVIMRNTNKKRALKKYLKQNELSESDIAFQKSYKFKRDIKFSIVVPLYNTPENFLHDMIKSVNEQTYSNWELCLADGSDNSHLYVKEICDDYSKNDSRIKYIKLTENLGISENTNAAITLATGDYIALFDHDDYLHNAALFEYMKVVCEQNADFIYCDEIIFENKIDNAVNSHFKPDFAPDNLRGNNYICHFSVFSRELFEKVGGFRKEFDGSQDYDMILRLTEKAERIVHIPRVLYFWRKHSNSVASNVGVKPYALIAAHKALEEHLQRMSLSGTVVDSSELCFYRINYAINKKSLISIIIPNKDSIVVLKKCIDSILELSTYSNYEIIIVENNSKSPDTFEYYKSLEHIENIKIVYYEGEFNYSKINNFGFKYAKGDYIVLLNNDIEVITPNWLEELLMFTQRKDVGATGAMLYYGNNTIQHAGILISKTSIGALLHRNYPRQVMGYVGRLVYAQNLSAVTAACMMIKRDAFLEVNGFNESLAVAYNDVDLCMRIRKANYLICFTPYAKLYHHESYSRGNDCRGKNAVRLKQEIDLFRELWLKELEQGDPYYNKNLSDKRGDFSLKFE